MVSFWGRVKDREVIEWGIHEGGDKRLKSLPHSITYIEKEVNKPYQFVMIIYWKIVEHFGNYSMYDNIFPSYKMLSMFEFTQKDDE